MHWGGAPLGVEREVWTPLSVPSPVTWDPTVRWSRKYCGKLYNENYVKKHRVNQSKNRYLSKNHVKTRSTLVNLSEINFLLRQRRSKGVRGIPHSSKKWKTTEVSTSFVV